MSGNNPENISLYSTLSALVYVVIVAVAGLLIYIAFGQSFTGDLWSHHSVPEIRRVQVRSALTEDGTDLATGLIYAKGFTVVKSNCTNCHSAKLITQNRATREGWHQMIRWMQETQGLWALGKNEAVILDYLAEHYGPSAVGRRPVLALENIEWYHLDEYD